MALTLTQAVGFLLLQIDMEGSQTAPPSKRMKTKQEDKDVELGERPRNGHKFTNQDLPPECRSIWRSVYIPSLAHWCGGSVDPWTIGAGELQNAMQTIWGELYYGMLEHNITLKGAVFQVV